MSRFPFNKALVTGGAGFIGSHVVEALVKMGVETVSIDNYFAGTHLNLQHLKGYDNFHEINCDITDVKTLDEHFAGVDVVFHQAASKKTICMKDPRKDLEINGAGTYNLLELSVKHKVKKFVHASTGSVYGEPIYFPQDERHPLNPVSYYGVSKLAGERYVSVFAHLYGLDTTILRYFHIYGPRQESSNVGGVVSIFVRNLLTGHPITIFGDGTQIRSFTYVDDVVKANLAAATEAKAKGEVFNCTSGIQVTIGQLATMVSECLKIPNPDVRYDTWTPGDIKFFKVDNSKIKNALGLTFLTDFNRGLQLTVDWGKEFFLSKLGNVQEQ